MKVRIPLVGQPNQRNLDSLQALIEGKDQRYRSGVIIPITNPITGQSKVYFEKRPGFEAATIGNCLGVISEDCAGTVLHFSRATNKYISVFCETNVFVDCDSAGEITGETTDNSGHALFANGNQSGGFASRAAQKYVFATDVTAITTTNMTTNTGNLAAAGNYTIAIYAGGSTGASNEDGTCKYTYSTETGVSSTVLSTERSQHAAAGTATIALFAGGAIDAGATKSNTTEKWTFATDGVASATDLNFSSARSNISGAGSSTIGIFGHGTEADNDQPTVTCKYTYGTDVASNGSSLSYGCTVSAACGSPLKSFWGGGNVSGDSVATVIGYTYASDVVALTTSLVVARRNLAAASNHTYGMFMGGVAAGVGTTPLASNEKYDLLDETVTAGTALVFTQYSHAASSSSPGHL